MKSESDKWGAYRNGWFLGSEPDPVKSENWPKNLLVSVWWTIAVQYSFLKSGQTITAELQTMMEKLAAKQPRLVNRSTLLLQRQR